MLHTDPSTVLIALRFMLYGVSGVFVVLAIFYIVIKILLKLFPVKKAE